MRRHEARGRRRCVGLLEKNGSFRGEREDRGDADASLSNDAQSVFHQRRTERHLRLRAASLDEAKHVRGLGLDWYQRYGVSRLARTGEF